MCPAPGTPEVPQMFDEWKRREEGGASVCKLNYSAVSAGKSRWRSPGTAGLAAEQDHPQHLLDSSPCATQKRKRLMSCSSRGPREEISKTITTSRNNMPLIRHYFKLLNASV